MLLRNTHASVDDVKFDGMPVTPCEKLDLATIMRKFQGIGC